MMIYKALFVYFVKKEIKMNPFLIIDIIIHITIEDDDH